MQIGLSTILQRLGFNGVSPSYEAPGQGWSSPSLWNVLAGFAERFRALVSPSTPTHALPATTRGDTSGVFKISDSSRVVRVDGLALNMPQDPIVARSSSRIYRAESSRGAVAVKEFIVPENLAANDVSESADVLLRRAQHEESVMRDLNERGIAGIPQVYGVVQDQKTGHPLLAMQHINGVSLKDILDGKASGRFNTSDLIGICYKVLVVLQKMEAAGIVHNDLKPSNIILTSAGDVYVIDFGSAQWVHDLHRGDGVRTFGTEGFVYQNGTVASTQVEAERRNLLNVGQLLYAFLGNGEPTSFVDDVIAVGVEPPLNASRSNLPAPIVSIVHRLLHLNQDLPALSEVTQVFAAQRSFAQRLFAREAA